MSCFMIRTPIQHKIRNSNFIKMSKYAYIVIFKAVRIKAVTYLYLKSSVRVVFRILKLEDWDVANESIQ